jgi:hypothetical protein
MVRQEVEKKKAEEPEKEVKEEKEKRAKPEIQKEIGREKGLFGNLKRKMFRRKAI